MADGELRLKLDDETQRQLAEHAAALGVTVETYVLDMIAEDMELDPIAVSIARLEEYDRTGAFMTVDQAMAHFDRELEAARTRRR
jgi:hypothetical protein